MSLKRKSTSDSDDDIPIGKLVVKKRLPSKNIKENSNFDNNTDYSDEDNLSLGKLLAKRKLSSSLSSSIPIKKIKSSSDSENQSDESNDELPLGLLVAKKIKSSPSLGSKQIILNSLKQKNNSLLSKKAEQRPPLRQLQTNQIFTKKSTEKVPRDLDRIQSFLEINLKKSQDEREKHWCRSFLLRGIIELVTKNSSLTRNDIETKTREFSFCQDDSDSEFDGIQRGNLEKSPVVSIENLRTYGH